MTAPECLFVKPQSRALTARDCIVKTWICAGKNMAVNRVRHRFLCNNFVKTMPEFVIKIGLLINPIYLDKSLCQLENWIKLVYRLILVSGG